jgi:hypothetical protein
MNFSALNTHAIGVISASAGVATVEGAASLSAGASASAQATLHSHATASVINSVALTTTQSVVRFAMATATLGCNAAANVEGYRVQFSNAEIVCAASSDANAVVYRQAAAFVTAQATNVAVGSRVAYASASLQAECDLTANSGVATFVSSVIAATAAMSSSSYVIWAATGAFTGSSLAISVGEKKAVAQTTLVASAELIASATSGAFSSAQVTAQSNIIATASIIHDTITSVTASSSLSRSDTQTFVVTASGGNYVIASQSNRPLDFKVGSTYTFDLSSSSNGSHPLRFSTTNNGTHGGGSEYTTGVTITGNQGQAGSSISIVVTEDTPSTLYYYCAYHSGMGGTVSVSSADDVSASINSFASAALNGSALIAASAASVVETSVTITSVSELTATANLVVDVGAAFDSSSNVTAEAIAISDAQASVAGSSSLSSVGYNVSSASATFIGSSIAISVGHKKSVAHTNINANADVSSAANSEVYNAASVAASAVVSSIAANYSSAQASCVAQSSVSSSAFNTANPNAAIIAHANISATTSTTHFATANIDGSCVIATAPSLIIDVSAALSAFAVSISVGNKISVGHAQYTGSANLTAVAQASSNGQATVTCSASVSSSAIAARIIPAEAHVSDSSYVVAGYTTWYDSWANVNGAKYYKANSNNYFLFQAVPGIWPPTYTLSSTSPSLAPLSQANTGYQYRIGSSLSSGSYDTFYINGVYYQGYWKHIEVNTPYSVYTPPVTVYTGYTPNAQVVVSDVTVLSGSFAYPTGSAEVTATGTRVRIGIADVTSAASATSTAFKVRFIDASAVVNATADLSLSVTVDILGSAQVLADAEATAESFNTVFASGTFSGSSLAISVGNKKAVGQTDIVANASVSVASSTYVIFDASAAINPSVTMSAVGDLVIITAGQSTATATASIVASAYLSESVASASVNAGASAFADGDMLISAEAHVSDSSYVVAGYTIPAYDTWVDTAAATYWVKFDNSEIQISTVWLSIAPYYANTTYNGTNIPTTITNTLNNSAPAGTTYYTYLSHAQTRSGVSGYIGGFKQRVTTTHPAVWVDPVTVYTGYAPRANVVAEATIQFSFSLTASSELSATAGAIQTASAQISASADTTAASHIESTATCTLNGTASISPVNTNFLVFTSAALSASSDVVSLADKEIYGKADVVGTADIAVSGTGINAAFGYSNAAASVVATAFRMRVPSPINAIATAELVSSFTYVSQTGERSNGILILVEAEVRSIAVEAVDRRIIVDAEDRTIFAEAA